MKQGFTLIELMVVVLIIGILSSVALPQYQKSVEKARAAEALSTLGSLYRQYESCRLEHRDKRQCDQVGAFKNFTIRPPGTKVADECYETKEWRYCPPFQSDIRAYRISSGGIKGVLTIWGYGYGSSGKDCLGTITCENEDDASFCKTLGFTAKQTGCSGFVKP